MAGARPGRAPAAAGDKCEVGVGPAAVEGSLGTGTL